MPLPSDTTVSSALRTRGQRVTPQRLAIATAVRDLDTHVTAEQVFSRVAQRFPGVSLPTVYATLELLEDLGFVRRLAGRAGVTVYDPRVDEHHHLVCSRCGAIADVDGHIDDAGLRESAVGAGFTPEGCQVVISGLCADCSARSN
jgi:Fe2+ or Zn2+ uptake regulation protein